MSDNQPDIRIDYDEEGLYPPEDYCGVWEVYWPNRQLKYRACYVDGKENGEVKCWWENGILAQSGWRDHGECRGLWTDYFEDGARYKETEYRDNDNFVVRWYSNGTIDRTEVWKEGRHME